ncbi:MAG: NUDIX hydrolase [Gammaproteobacteria bacterium]
MVWKPHVTVAAIAEQEGRFLVVEERVRGQLVINNPAGHLEESESFQDAIRREMLEETGWEFEPDILTGIYLWKNQRLDTTFLRMTFFGHCIRHHPDRPLDRGIVGPKWLTRDELKDGRHILRSPMVVRCIDDYLAGCRYPLELLTCFPRFDTSLDDA